VAFGFERVRSAEHVAFLLVLPKLELADQASDCDL